MHPQAPITRELHPKIQPSVLQHELPWKPLFVSGPVAAILNRGFQCVALLRAGTKPAPPRREAGPEKQLSFLAQSSDLAVAVSLYI